MESILAEKITTKTFFCILGYVFILFVTSFQSSYLIFQNQKVTTHFKEQNKKRIMTIGKKKVIQSKKMSKKSPENAKF